MENLTNFMFNNPILSVSLFVLLMFWSLIWKGLALWKSARNNQIIWFVVFLLISTVGILEILYIFIFSKRIKLKKNKAK